MLDSWMTLTYMTVIYLTSWLNIIHDRLFITILFRERYIYSFRTKSYESYRRFIASILTTNKYQSIKRKYRMDLFLMWWNHNISITDNMLICNIEVSHRVILSLCYYGCSQCEGKFMNLFSFVSIIFLLINEEEKI